MPVGQFRVAAGANIVIHVVAVVVIVIIQPAVFLFRHFRRRNVGRSVLFIFVHAFLTKATFAGERDAFAGWEGLFAPGAGKAILVVGLAQRGDDFAFHVIAALSAFRAVVGLVAVGAIVILILGEESPLRQRTAAASAFEAPRMEVTVVHAENFARTLFLATAAISFSRTSASDELKRRSERSQESAAFLSAFRRWISGLVDDGRWVLDALNVRSDFGSQGRHGR